MRVTHPGVILREGILKEIKMSNTAAAAALGVSRKQVSEIVNETAGISPEMALRLEKVFGVEAYFWLGIQAKYDLWKTAQSGKIRKLRKVTKKPASRKAS